MRPSPGGDDSEDDGEEEGKKEIGHEQENRDDLNRCVTRYYRDEVNVVFIGEQHVGSITVACQFHAPGTYKFDDRYKQEHKGSADSGKGSPVKGDKGSDDQQKMTGSEGESDQGQAQVPHLTPAAELIRPTALRCPGSTNLPCHAWNDGECDRNPCPFVQRAFTEEEKENRPVRATAPAAANGAKVCNFFMKGKCNKGAECKYQHPGNGSVPGTPRPKKKGGGATGSPAPPV